MSRIKLGYGSEWHMLRMLGRHRAFLNAEVLKQTGGSVIEWVDFSFTSGIAENQNYGDGEAKGVNFLDRANPAREEWRQWWPQTGNVPNWDAVGVHRMRDVDEWLLVEAKGNIEELRQSTTAKRKAVGGGLEDIEMRLDETQRAMGISPPRVWTKDYYQYANRLAVLHFLTTQAVPARLLFIYFIGDLARPQATCPATAEEWSAGLTAMKVQLGLTGASELEQRVHHLFLPVCQSTTPLASGRR